MRMQNITQSDFHAAVNHTAGAKRIHCINSALCLLKLNHQGFAVGGFSVTSLILLSYYLSLTACPQVI